MDSNCNNKIADEGRDRDTECNIEDICGKLDVVKIHNDEELFKQPPPEEDCPICFDRLPSLRTGRRYNVCCGKDICTGCVNASLYDDRGNKVDNRKCPFCRTPYPESESDEEHINNKEQRVEAGDAIAMVDVGINYGNGRYGYPQDYTKALELYHRAAGLGCAKAYACIAVYYEIGKGVEVDKKKAIHYYELAAIRGCEQARHDLGCMEANAGNHDRAVKHYMIAVRSGNADSLKKIQEYYSNGYATKDEYAKALRLYQTYISEIKSEQRDEVAATYKNCRYY